MIYHDLTLRDGSHAISHQLTEEMIINYCIFAIYLNKNRKFD